MSHLLRPRVRISHACVLTSLCRTGAFAFACGHDFAIVGGERPCAVHTTHATLQEGEDINAMEVRAADVEALYGS
jgi:hypothetical protein